MSSDLPSVPSRLEHVTVYAAGARVRRIVTLTAPLPPVVRVAGLPLGLIDDSVRIEVDGAAVVTAVRCTIDTPAAADAAAEETAELRAARHRLALADAELVRIMAALEAGDAATMIDSELRDEPAPAWDAVVAARRALVAIRFTREHALRTQLARARRDVDAAHRALEVVVECDARAGTARAVKLHELRKAVELDLAAASGAADDAIEIHVEYQVAAARWAPSYVARLDGDRVRFELRAVVAQASGEDWNGVTVVVSTAEPARFAMLPELAAQRIGRRQDAPARRGFRDAPIGARELYADFDRTFADRVGRADRGGRGGVPPIVRVPAPSAGAATLAGMADGAIGSLGSEVWDDETSRSKDAFDQREEAKAFGAMPIAAMTAMTAMAPSAAMSRGAPRMRSLAPGGGAASHAAPSEVAPPTIEPRLDYNGLRMPLPIARERGALVSAGVGDAAERGIAGAVNAHVASSAAAVDRLEFPAGYSAGWPHMYDYAFAADGLVEVVADGAWHGLPLTARPSTATMRHVAVPRERADVYRVASIPNPLAGPLLPGPIDVYDRGQFLLTSRVDYTPPGAIVEIGLGVDATVKLARNTEFREEAAGMLRGALRLHHGITIEAENLSTRPIELEVRERLPVTREGDDDVDLIVARVDPAWERWTPEPDGPDAARLRGGHRWRITVPGGGKRTLRAGYEVKIGSKHELVGGNRRES